MTIKGLEILADENLVTAITLYIYKNYSYSDEVNITVDDDNIYSINDERLVILSNSDEKDIINDYNEELFDMEVYDVPRNWRDYIDKDKWIDDFGLNDIVDYYSSVLNMDIKYLYTYSYINFYKVE